jgi:hypothetical protein
VIVYEEIFEFLKSQKILLLLYFYNFFLIHLVKIKNEHIQQNKKFLFYY